MNEFNKINLGLTDYKRENDLYVESGGAGKIIGDNKNDELFKMIGSNGYIKRGIER